LASRNLPSRSCTPLGPISHFPDVPGCSPCASGPLRQFSNGQCFFPWVTHPPPPTRGLGVPSPDPLHPRLRAFLMSVLLLSSVYGRTKLSHFSDDPPVTHGSLPKTSRPSPSWVEPLLIRFALHTLLSRTFLVPVFALPFVGCGNPSSMFTRICLDQSSLRYRHQLIVGLWPPTRT